MTALSKTLTTQIMGVGHYLPPKVVSNDQLAERIGVEAEWIERTTGVIQRRRVDGETTIDMAAKAVQHALNHASVPSDEVDVLISACAGRLQTIPCTAAFIHEQLGLPSTCFAFDVDATCMGFLVALNLAGSLLEQPYYRHIAIVSSEVASGTIDYTQPESAVLFGDAAAAAIVRVAPPGSSSKILLSRFRTHSEGVRMAQIRGGGTLNHPNCQTTTPEMNLFQMRGSEIFKLATRHMANFLDDFFVELTWQREIVDRVVPHQASRMATRQLTKRYGFRPDQVLENIAYRGNCVAASMPLMLSEAVHDGRIDRGQRLLLVGTGAGLTLGASALIF